MTNISNLSLHIFGDSNVWGDEQPNCTIGVNSQPSKTTFPYYLAKKFDITDIHNHAVSGGSLQLVCDSILFNFLPKNYSLNDIIIVYLPNCAKYSFVTNDRKEYKSIEDIIRYRLRSCIYDNDLKKDTVNWMMKHMWHEQALYYNVIKHVATIDIFLKDYKNVFYFWNTRHHLSSFREGQDGLDSELKFRNAWFPTDDIADPFIGDDVFDNNVIEQEYPAFKRIKERTVDWDILSVFDSISDQLSVHKYKQKHHAPQVHEHYVDTFLYEHVKEKLNVD